MSKGRPFFSIVIPTRNRPGLFAHALRSALAQTWTDYEIIVTDNGDDDSKEATAAVVRGAGGDSVRYVRTPAPLPMADNWEFGLRQATGKFVTYLCDDDAMVPELLETVAQVIEAHNSEVVTWSCGSYYHPNWVVAEQRNTAALVPASDHVESIASRPVLDLLYRELWPPLPIPKMMQSCCSMRVLDRIRQRAGRLFIPSCPDFSSPALIFDEVERYEHIDRTLLLSGAAPESTGPMAWTKDRAALRRFAAETGEVFREVPLHALTGHNAIADTLLRVKKLLGPRLEGIDLDWTRYFAYNYEILRTFENMGADNIAAEMKEFHEVLGRRPAEFQSAVWQVVKQRRHHSSWLQRLLRETIDKSGFLSQLELRLRPKIRKSKPRIIRGEEYGFSNICECAAKIGRLQSGVHCAPEPSPATAA